MSNGYSLVETVLEPLESSFVFVGKLLGALALAKHVFFVRQVLDVE